MTKLNNLLIEATIIINDRNITSEIKIEIVSKVNDKIIILNEIKKYFKKYRYAYDLSTKYTYNLKEYSIIGNC